MYFCDRVSVGSIAVDAALRGQPAAGRTVGPASVLNLELQLLGLDGDELGPGHVSHTDLLGPGDWKGHTFTQLDLSNIPRSDDVSGVFTRVRHRMFCILLLFRWQVIACTAPTTASLALHACVDDGRKKKKKGAEQVGSLFATLGPTGLLIVGWVLNVAGIIERVRGQCAHCCRFRLWPFFDGRGWRAVRSFCSCFNWQDRNYLRFHAMFCDELFALSLIWTIVVACCLLCSVAM